MPLVRPALLKHDAGQPWPLFAGLAVVQGEPDLYGAVVGVRVAVHRESLPARHPFPCSVLARTRDATGLPRNCMLEVAPAGGSPTGGPRAFPVGAPRGAVCPN